MPSIEEQYKTAAKKCQSYSYCTGCSIKIPKPTISDVCAQNPLACMEKESTQHLRTYKEKAFTASEIDALQREARGEITEFKEYFYTGNTLAGNALTVTKENFKNAVTQFCSDAKAVAASDRVSNWCKERMAVFSNLEHNITQEQQAQATDFANDFVKQRKQSIDKYIEGKNAKVYDLEKRRWVLQ